MIINNVKYLTLSEYCEAVNAERSKTGLNPISEGAVRTKVARHQIPAEKIGCQWMVVSGTPWPEKTVRQPIPVSKSQPKQERTIMKMKNFKINSENITNIAARIVVAVGIIVLVVVAFKLAAFLLTKILFPLLGGVIQILFEATSWIILLFLISRTKTFQKAYNAARGKHEEKENKNK